MRWSARSHQCTRIICIYWLWPNGFNKLNTEHTTCARLRELNNSISVYLVEIRLKKKATVIHKFNRSVYIQRFFGSLTMQLEVKRIGRGRKKPTQFTLTMQRMKIKSQDFEDKCAWNIINHIECSFTRTMYAILICERIWNILLSFFGQILKIL